MYDIIKHKAYSSYPDPWLFLTSILLTHWNKQHMFKNLRSMVPFMGFFLSTAPSVFAPVGRVNVTACASQHMPSNCGLQDLESHILKEMSGKCLRIPCIVVAMYGNLEAHAWFKTVPWRELEVNARDKRGRLSYPKFRDTSWFTTLL